MGWFGSHGVAQPRALEQKRKQKMQPNLRRDFDNKSRKGMATVAHKTHKKMPEEALQMLRTKISKEKRQRNKRMVIVLFITLIIVLIAFWGVPKLASSMHDGGGLKVPALQNQ